MQEYIPFFQAEKRSIAEKLAKYFEYSGLETKIHFDEEIDSYILSVPSKKEKEAKKFYQAFYFVERDKIENEEKDTDSLEEINESNILSTTNDEDASVSSQDISNQEIASASLVDSDSDTASDTDKDKDEVTDEVIDEVIDEVTDENTAEVTDEDTADDSASTEEGLASEEVNPMDSGDTSEDANPIDSADTSEEPINDIEKDQKSQIRDLLSSSGSYVMKAEKHKDYISTQYLFLILGFAGLVFVFLNVIEVLTFLYGLFPNLIMGALFLFFIYEGLSTANKARSLKQEIEEENQLTDKINQWLHTNVTNEFLASISNSELSEELDYIKKTDTIRDMLIKEFGEQNRDYLDRLIEDFYTETFDASNNYIEES